MYKLVKNFQGNICAVNREDGASIPFDPDNVDFQQYQLWLSEGNIPDEPDADESL